MGTGSQAWFWFPDRRMGLVYRNEPAVRQSCALRTEPSTGARWVLQIAPRGSRLMCFDAPAPQEAERFQFAAAPGEAVRLDSRLVPRAADRPGIVAVPPDGWDTATIAWLTKAPEPLRVRRLTASGVDNRGAISARDVGASIAELADAALSFGADDRIGPAVRPILVAEKPRVQVTFPASPTPKGFKIPLQLLDDVLQEVTVHLLLREQKKRRIERAQTVKLGPRSKSEPFVLEKLGYGDELYVQAAESVDLCHRDQSGALASGGQLLARKFVLRDLIVFEPDTERHNALPAHGVVGTAEALSVRDNLLRHRDLAALAGAATSIDNIPAPLFAALLEHATQATNDRLGAAVEFLHWPAAAQLRLSLGRNAVPDGEAHDGEDATLAMWRRARVDGTALGWLSADPQRQITILPLLAQLGDASRALEAVQRIRNVASDRLADTVKALAAIDDPAWTRFVALEREGGDFRKRGDQLLAECRSAANDDDDIRDRRERLEQYERDARRRLGELAQARRQFERYAGEIAAAVGELARSRGDGLAAFESLAEKYRSVAGDKADDPAVAALAQELANGTAPTFAFDDDALRALARERWEDRKRQAQVIRWFEQLIALLGPGRGAAEVPAWPEKAEAGDPLAPRVRRIEERLSDAALRGADEKIAGLARHAEARQLSADLGAKLERSREAIAAMRVNELGLDMLHARMERCADAIVLACLRNALHARHDTLLTRGATIADGRVGRAASEAWSAAESVTDTTTLNAWSDALSKLELEIAAVEGLQSELQALRDRLSPQLCERLAEGVGPGLSDHVDAEIKMWGAETEAAAALLLRAQACVQALGGQELSLEALSVPQPPAAADDPHHLHLLLAWSRYRTQQLAKLDAIRAPLAELARAALTRGCPDVPWDEDAGEKVADALVAADGEPADVHRSFEKTIGLLDSVWGMTGGKDPQVRALLWLRRDHPAFSDIEALIAMAAHPEGLVGGLSGATPDTKPAFTRSAEFRRFVGNMAAFRLSRLAKDDNSDAMRISRTFAVTEANTFDKAIPLVIKLLQLARTCGPVMSPAEAATLQAVLKRHELWPPPDHPSGSAGASSDQPEPHS